MLTDYEIQEESYCGIPIFTKMKFEFRSRGLKCAQNVHYQSQSLVKLFFFQMYFYLHLLLFLYREIFHFVVQKSFSSLFFPAQLLYVMLCDHLSVSWPVRKCLRSASLAIRESIPQSAYFLLFCYHHILLFSSCGLNFMSNAPVFLSVLSVDSLCRFFSFLPFHYTCLFLL